jgi:hypothetical protein
MSTTQELDEELEVNFHEQVNDLMRCFKYLYIFKKEYRSDSGFISLADTNPDPGHAKRNIRLDVVSSIVADKEAKLLTKGKVHLVPARLHFNFTSDHATALKCAPASVPLDSDIVKSITHEKGAWTLAESFLTWATMRHKRQYVIDLQHLNSINLPLNLKWKFYHTVDSDITDDILYAHFPVRDSWVVVRFTSLSDASTAIQIINERYGYVVDCSDVNWHYKLNSPTFIGPPDGMSRDNYSKVYTLDPALDSGALFDLVEVERAAEELLSNFKDDQEDGYIDADELDDSPLTFLCGSEDNLARMINLVCHAAIPMSVWGAEASIDVEIFSATDDGDPARIAWDNMSYNSWENVKERLDADKISFIENAFDVALEQNTPNGHTWEYNDGSYDRQSGYDKSPQYLSVTVTAPSAHEQICAKIEMKKLARLFGKSVVQGLLK